MMKEIEYKRNIEEITTKKYKQDIKITRKGT